MGISQIGTELFEEGNIRAVWNDAFLFQEGEHSHWLEKDLSIGKIWTDLFEEGNGWLEISSIANMIPLNSLFLVFRLKNWLFPLPIFCHLLFDKHEMIEELLQFLIGKVDAELFE